MKTGVKLAFRCSGENSEEMVVNRLYESGKSLAQAHAWSKETSVLYPDSLIPDPPV